MFWAEIWKIFEYFVWKFSIFRWLTFQYIWIGVFVMSHFLTAVPKRFPQVVFSTKTTTPIWYTVPKYQHPFGLPYQNGILCQKVHTHFVYSLKSSALIWSTVPKRVYPFGLLCQNSSTVTPIWPAVSNRHLVYSAKTSKGDIYIYILHIVSFNFQRKHVLLVFIRSTSARRF